MADSPQTLDVMVTQAMMDAGRAAFGAVAERHGFEGLLNIGFINNAIASAYLAMERERAELPRSNQW